MRRLLIEAGLAAMIFFAANAIFGVDALIGKSLASISDGTVASAQIPGNTGSHRGKTGDMQLPAPIDVDMQSAPDVDRYFCLQPRMGSQLIQMHLSEPVLALTSANGPIPNFLSIDLNSQNSDSLAGTVTAGSCRGKGNVRIQVKMSKDAWKALEKSAIAHTVTLFVDPE